MNLKHIPRPSYRDILNGLDLAWPGSHEHDPIRQGNRLDQIVGDKNYAPPSSAHWLGTDDGGGDMLSLLIAGQSRVSLGVGFLAALVAILIGGTVGVLSGFFGGTTDTVLMRFTDYMLVIPDIPLMIIAAALFGRNLINIIVIIGIIYWTSTARLIRAQVKTRARARLREAGAGARRRQPHGSCSSTCCRR